MVLGSEGRRVLKSYPRPLIQARLIAPAHSRSYLLLFLRSDHVPGLLRLHQAHVLGLLILLLCLLQGFNSAMYVLNSGTTHDQFDSVCCTLDGNGDLWVSYDKMRK